MSRHYQGSYDPARFNVPPNQGKDGHAQRMQFNIQAGHARAIEQILRSGVFPFGIDADFGRWAIQEALEQIDSLEPELINSVMKRSNMMNYKLRLDSEQQKFTEWLNELRSAVQGHLGRRDKDQARMLVEYCYQQVQAMADQPDSQKVFKKKYVEALVQNFESLLPGD